MFQHHGQGERRVPPKIVVPQLLSVTIQQLLVPVEQSPTAFLYPSRKEALNSGECELTGQSYEHN